MLTVELAPPPLATAPLTPTAAAGFAIDDPAARGVLRRAQGMFQKWPEGFSGFRASMRCETADGVVEGRLTVAAPAQVNVLCEHASVCAWLSDTFSTIAGARTPRFFDEGDGRFPISWSTDAPDGDGRAVEVHCPIGRLRYWINARGRISQVERIASGLRVVTTFDELVRATPGRVLPARTTTSTWDVATGALLHSEAVQDSHRRLEHVWLPACRRIDGRLAPGAAAIEVTLEDHQLL